MSAPATDAALAAAARGTAEAAAEAIGWLADNRAKVREEAQAVARDFRKFARRARKLERKRMERDGSR